MNSIIPTAPLPTVFPPKAVDGWMLVGSLNMLDYKNQKCPSQWRAYTYKKACGRIPGQKCSSVRVPTGSDSFQQVCGRFRAFQQGSPDAFAGLFVTKPAKIDDPYVDGISITYNNAGGQRKHVFTYAAGFAEQFSPGNWPQCTCPCAGGAEIPSFVRTSDYYCESGNPDNSWLSILYCDPLWDGKECRYSEESCCNPPHQPWFCKNLDKRVNSDLEIRLCADQGVDNEDIALESYELWVR